jgi:hypothetical protein
VSVPGSNLLNMALGLIGAQSVEWMMFNGTTTTDAGIEVSAFSDPISVSGSLQPAPNTLIQNLGLDWTKNYVMFYASAAFVEPGRDLVGDRIRYAGLTYSVENRVSWFAQDGWDAVLCVELTNA